MNLHYDWEVGIAFPIFVGEEIKSKIKDLSKVTKVLHGKLGWETLLWFKYVFTCMCLYSSRFTELCPMKQVSNTGESGFLTRKAKYQLWFFRKKKQPDKCENRVDSPLTEIQATNTLKQQAAIVARDFACYLRVTVT